MRQLSTRRIAVLTAILAVFASVASPVRAEGQATEDILLAACPSSPNCVSSLAQNESQHISPFAGGSQPTVTFALLDQLLASRTDTQIVSKRPGYLSVVFHTTFFQDDGEFLLESEQSVIHVRSASRTGYWDFGKNRRRLEEIRKQLESMLHTD